MPIFLDKPSIFDWDTICALDTDALAVLISILGWTFSIIGLWYVRHELRTSIKNRNLAFSSDVDKILIDKPKLWEFYDGHKGKYHRSDPERPQDIPYTIEPQQIVTINECMGLTIKSENKKKFKVIFYIKDRLIYEKKVKEVTFDRSGSCRIESCEARTTISSAIGQELSAIDMTLFSRGSMLHEAQLDAFTYFMLNHFEVILLEKNQDTYPGWRRYMKYCYKRSDRFRRIICKIVDDDEDFRGLYGIRFTKELKKIKSEYEINQNF